MSAATDQAVYKTLLESTRAIPWKIDWKTMTFAYIGPQIETLLGWSQASWVSAEDWATRMHPDDREKVVQFCIAQSQNGVDHEADYRALTAAGDYVWIRDVVHVVRDDNGEVDALIGFMFDISERKKTEEQLLTLQKQLEEYSYKDGLTGVANRRMFDMVLATEWANAQRSQQPLSLILLDIDHFKQYNDHYGHVQGDDCLKSVGQALSRAVKRPRDFVGRFGGEEFVLVLPETDEAAARHIAERCRQQVRQQRIAHARSAVSSLLTISLGVGTIVPGAHDRSQDFLSAVDKLLYQAKQRGRDRLEVARAPARPGLDEAADVQA
ncbi:Phytochrome-like protein cph2 [Pseudomonas oleovorans subsp. oleovorans]|uniref:diguanylate cyclase n=1 Tax=Ectopseudomonas oleovorans TaxID=301 RepID=A0A379JSW5_ECTOL|nr:sensor domain-containing diguanylate cyclase [Pseudomonas oleovorans]KFJ90665.1 diguanylate cyclase [Pseudomonas sp. 1-7]OWK42576.1 Phytochrome-like protein cph2 [Pseudomonas oleovorans subsp. oleovorans]PZP86565.1 MAG: GGDEF domain-containing protein [Pseudomonas oleovorans]RRW38640.1 diguanylate cyclase [Pseudomonas oleovorans]SEJ28866.1 PAS domain S-box-containing protein/diguanylate cyclase (GGDEF) domain-containing protein [Pseudomonas oleovorans]